jgi:ElaB/YqjD/DUF883 family membrane-anchored ribosome-binding protein
MDMVSSIQHDRWVDEDYGALQAHGLTTIRVNRDYAAALADVQRRGAMAALWTRAPKTRFGRIGRKTTMPNKTRSVGNPTASDANSSARDLSQRARDAAASMTEAADEAAAAIDDSRSTAAEGLDTAASALHDGAEDLPGGETVRDFARATADRLSSSADYVRSHDAKRVMADVATFVKSNPGAALAVAAAFGFLLGRALSRD